MTDARKAGLAQRLREARERAGLTIDDLSRQTGVAVRYVRMLEEDDFPLVADRAYLTPFLRKIAMRLGVDAAQAAREFLLRVQSEEVLVRVRPERRKPERPLVQMASPSSGRALRIGGSIVAIAAGIGLAFATERSVEVPELARLTDGWKETLGSVLESISVPREPAPSSLVAPPPAPPAVVEAPAPPAVALGQVAADASAPEPALAEVTAAAVLPPDPAAAAAVRASAPPVPPVLASAPRQIGPQPPYVLRVTATARQVWVWVSADGGPRQAVSLDRGESRSWTASNGYVISVDDASGVAVNLNGENLPSLGTRQQALRNLVIPSPELPVG